MIRKPVQHLTLQPITKEEDNTIKFAETAKGVNLKSTYTSLDVLGISHQNFAAGIPPYLRGIDSTMYLTKPWSVKQYASFNTITENVDSIKHTPFNKQHNLSVVFNFPNQTKDNANNKSVLSKKSIVIQTVEDMKMLFDKIALEKISVSINTDVALLPILAFYIVAAQEKGIALNQLSGSIKNNVFKELLNNNINKNSGSITKKISSDILKFTGNHMPKFNRLNISGYALQENGVNCDAELAYTLAKGLDYLKTGLKAGINIDSLAPRLSFSWCVGINHFIEIAKIRAARMLWAKIVNQFNPKNTKSLALHAHCQTSNATIKTQNSYHNIAKNTLKAAAAVFGGTQSLQIGSIDNAISVSAKRSSRFGRNTPLYLQEETKIIKTVDPWAGSYYVENLTHDIAEKSWTIIERIEKIGGITNAIEAGIFKLQDAETAGKDQAINTFKYEVENANSRLNIEKNSDNKTQIASLHAIKPARNTDNLASSLSKLKLNANSKKDNILNLAINAAKARATLKEIMDAVHVR